MRQYLIRSPYRRRPSIMYPSPGRRRQRFSCRSLGLELLVKGRHEIVTREEAEATSSCLVDASVRERTIFFRAWGHDGLDGQVPEVRMGRCEMCLRMIGCRPELEELRGVKSVDYFPTLIRAASTFRPPSFSASPMSEYTGGIDCRSLDPLRLKHRGQGSFHACRVVEQVLRQ